MEPKTNNPQEDWHLDLLTVPGYERLEFHRHGLALVPLPGEDKPGTAILLIGQGNESDLLTCSCSKAKKRTCEHMLELAGLYKAILKKSKGRSLYGLFRSSPWHALISVFGDGSREIPGKTSVRSIKRDGRSFLRILGTTGDELARYYSTGSDAALLLKRLGRMPQDNPDRNRTEALEKLALMTLTHDERIMREKGFKTFRMLLEETFWYRLASHCFHQFGTTGVRFHPAIDEATGDFTISCVKSEDEPFVRLVAPRNKVKALIKSMKENLPNQQGLPIHPIPLKSIFKVSVNTEMDLEIRPMIQLLQETGETRFFASEDFKRFRYGDLVYLKDLGLMAELERSRGPQRRFRSPVKMVLNKSQVPSYLDELVTELDSDEFLVDRDVKHLRIITHFDDIEIQPEAVDRDWYWLDVRYGFGNERISLADILRAKAEGQRFILTSEGWVDCQAPAFDNFESLARLDPEHKNRVGLSHVNMLRFRAVNETSVKVIGSPERTELLERFMELRPARPAGRPDGLTSELRPYQSLGFEWLRFLYENKLGGLLCDDMGLGKTHQAMALFASLAEGETKPIIVVCPTTVLSHWLAKINEHAPVLNAAVYHGTGRDIFDLLETGSLVLTSYGVLRQDMELLADINWSIAVFDEIQNVKNPKTQSYEAAQYLEADLKIGLTGTPIENRLEELKALFDLVLPGYLGKHQAFMERYVNGLDEELAADRRLELSRVISPFVLRRIKESVLDELPEKIINVRTCYLSEDQVKLYRDAVESRGRGILDALERREGPVPYIHIFALLNLLKQICNHPALVSDSWEDYQQLQSGKWEMFKEILDECLETRAKIVVYSQYMDMIRIIEDHLESLGIDYATLTGRSRNRGEIVSRFDRDPDCRVFVGSLKAGGVGIDLVAASVVIHYDRWWNAAREDQATDRVHRIGQRRGVHVFKLVTLGTLEEKISAIIDKKRQLFASVVREDDPGTLKAYSQEELIDLISFPQ